MAVAPGGRAATGIEWVETRDSAKHPTMQNSALTMKNYLASKVNRAQVEEPAGTVQQNFLL